MNIKAMWKKIKKYFLKPKETIIPPYQICRYADTNICNDCECSICKLNPYGNK